MTTQVKTKKNYLYNGLGVPILLESASFIKVNDEWLLKVDVEQIASKFFEALITKPAKFTGGEVKFIRTFLKLPKTRFGELFQVSHTAVGKWEKSENNSTEMSPAIQLQLRMYMADKLSASDRDFYKYYKGSTEAIYRDPTGPMSISA